MGSGQDLLNVERRDSGCQGLSPEGTGCVNDGQLGGRCELHSTGG